MEVEHKRQKNKEGSKIKVVGFLAVILLIIYIPSFFHLIFGDHTITTGMIQTGTIENSINSDAYLIRDEEVIKSPFEGTFIPSINEGEKTPSNYTIATVLNNQSKILLDDLKQNDQKIINAQVQKMKNKDFFSEDIKKIDNDIKDQVKLVIEDINSNDISQVKNKKTKIDELIKKKATIIGDIGTPDAYLSSLNKEKKSLQTQIDSNTRDIISKDSGIVSYYIDGYEDELNTSSINELTPQFLEKIKTVETEVNTVRKTEIGKPFAKIIKNIKYDIVVVLDVKNSDMIELDKNVSIRINDIGELINGRISFKSGITDGKCIVSIETDKALSETAGMRKVNIDIILDEYTGYKVPISCLSDINTQKMTAKIMLVRAGTTVIKTVSIDGKNNEYAIIDNPQGQGKNINLYDYYILDTHNIKEGQLIENVM